MARWIAFRLMLVVIGVSIPIAGAKLLQQLFGTTATPANPGIQSPVHPPR